MSKKVISGNDSFSTLTQHKDFTGYFYTKKDSKKRQRNNEDSIAYWENINKKNEHIFAISDGMGGLPNAELASQTTLKTCFSQLSKEVSSLTAIKKASLKVSKDTSGGGATLILCRWRKKELDFFSCGDSAAALFDRNGTLLCKTLAQNPYFFAQESGLLTELKSESPPPSNILLNFVGRKNVYTLSYSHLENPPGSYLFLGSDGFWENIEEEYLSLILREKTDIQEKCEKISNYFEDIETQGEFKHDDLSFIIIKKT